MRKNIILLALLFVVFGVLIIHAQPNPKWLSTDITMTPANPTEGDTVHFSATFRVAREAVTNLYVEAKMDGCPSFWNHTYPQLAKSQDVTVSCNWTGISGNHTLVIMIDPQNAIQEYLENDNEITKSFNVQQSGNQGNITDQLVYKIKATYTAIKKPDLKISLVFNPESPAVEQNTAIKAVVENIGSAPSPVTKMYIQIGSEPSPPEYPVPALNPGKHYSITRKWNPPGPGWALWTAEVDKEGLVMEALKNNNKISKKMIIRAPDLALFDVNIPDSDQLVGQKCLLRGTVKNIGSAPSGPFEIDAYFEPCAGIAQGRSWIRVDNGLAPGESYKFEFSHRFSCIGYKSASVMVDKDNKVKELDEKNNYKGYLGYVINIL